MDAVNLSYQDPDVQLEATYITDLGYLIHDMYMDDGWSTTSLTLTSCNSVMGSYSDLSPRVMTFSSGNEDVTVEFISESVDSGYLCRIVYGRTTRSMWPMITGCQSTWGTDRRSTRFTGTTLQSTWNCTTANS